MARDSDGELIVLHAINPLTDAAHVLAETGGEAIARVAADEQRRLEAELAVLTELSGIRVRPTVETLARGEDVPDHLVRAAEAYSADIIAIGSTRAAGVKGLLLGSVTQQVLRASARPVLVVRPGPKSASQP
jgi:nucleotide-binding universal stress UspA family protein